MENQNKLFDILQFTFYDPDCILSKHLSNVNQETYNLAKEYGLKYSKELTNLSGYVYSHLSYNSLILANDWHMWLWLFDDYVDNPKHSIDERKLLIMTCLKYVKTLKQEDNNLSIIAMSLYSLLIFQMNRIKIKTTSKFLQYFSLMLIDYLEKGVLNKKENLSIKEYEIIRYFDGACETVFGFSSLDDNIDNYIDLLKTKKKERKRANSVISKVNDLFSYKKDVFADETNFNFICLYMKENKLELKETIEKTINIINTQFSELIDEKLKKWCIGNLIWHSRCSRYYI